MVDPGVAMVVDPTLGRWRLDVVDAPAVGLTRPGLGPDAVVHVVPAGLHADAVTAELLGHGITARTAEVPGDDATAVIFVGGWLDDDALDVQRLAFETAKAVAARFATQGGLFVTVQDTGGDFGVSGSERAWFGGLPGLVKTVDQEWVASCKAIDAPLGARPLSKAAAAVVRELLFGGPEVEVGLLPDGRRITLRSVPDTVAPSPADGPGGATIDASSVIVASGGAKGVTAHTLVGLASAYGGRYVLLGRTALSDEPPEAAGHRTEAALKRALLDAARARAEMPKPAELGRQVWRILGAREIRETVARIQAAGGDARYLAVDVTDAASVDRALQGIRAEWGPVTGVVHGAGVLADKLVVDKTREQFDRVFDTKVKGLQALLAATAHDPVQLLVMFSSVAGRCGNRGQVDYAMANEVLAKVAAEEQRRRGGAFVAKALQWGPWEGGMVTPQLKAHFEAQGVPLIGLDAGATMLVHEVVDHSGSVELVLGGEPRMQPLVGSGDDAPQLELRVHLNRRSHPYLEDHSVAGRVIVPIVLVLEWFARAARAAYPSLQVAALRDVNVLRGIPLSGFDGSGDWFDISVRELPEGNNGQGAHVSLELRNLDGALHYRAVADLVSQHAPAPPRPAALALGPAGEGPIYDGDVLFHGATFQVIRSLDGASDQGLAATLSSTADVGWGTTPGKPTPPLSTAACNSHCCSASVFWVAPRCPWASTLCARFARVPLPDR